MRIALHGKPFSESVENYVTYIFEELDARQVSVAISKSFSEFLASKNYLDINKYQVFDNEANINGYDYLFSIGGDGTLLESMLFASACDIPVLGINAGRLGFLANVPCKEIKRGLKEFFNQEFSIEHRSMVSLEGNNGEQYFERKNIALNEFAITKRDSSSMILIHTWLNEEYLNSFWSDGLIVSTPTGSTGYNLSCGGPLISPEANSLAITPVSAHNLSVRPMIVPDTSVLKFKVEGRGSDFLVSLDSRSTAVPNGQDLIVKLHHQPLKLVKLNSSTYFKTLREKLNWGADFRN